MHCDKKKSIFDLCLVDVYYRHHFPWVTVQFYFYEIVCTIY